MFLFLVKSSPAHQYVNMFGYMEKLPLNTKKTADLKAWKRRFFDVKDGWLYYYEVYIIDISMYLLWILLFFGIIHIIIKIFINEKRSKVEIVWQNPL